LKAVIGLGNPGREYSNTRHNVGFMVVEELARRWGTELRPWRHVARTSRLASRDVILAEPTTFMNASGECVQQLAAFYKFEPRDALIVVDEIQLAVGRLKFSAKGSAGGHNGLKSVIEHFGSDFPRLRVGIGRGDPRWDLADHVLAPFQKEEREAVKEVVGRAADAVGMFLESGLTKAMNRYNAKDDKSDTLNSEL
jgi:PTH1 family peptidyl-tRNA hydrolase